MFHSSRARRRRCVIGATYIEDDQVIAVRSESPNRLWSKIGASEINWLSPCLITGIGRAMLSPGRIVNRVHSSRTVLNCRKNVCRRLPAPLRPVKIPIETYESGI